MMSDAQRGRRGRPPKTRSPFPEPHEQTPPEAGHGPYNCAYCRREAHAFVAENSPQRDMIIAWAEVQIGDLALDGGSLVRVESIRVSLQSDDHPDFLIACVSGWRVLDDGTPAVHVHLDPPAAGLTAVRRPGVLVEPKTGPAPAAAAQVAAYRNAAQTTEG